MEGVGAITGVSIPTTPHPAFGTKTKSVPVPLMYIPRAPTLICSKVSTGFSTLLTKRVLAKFFYLSLIE